jgi:lysyl-tRNA synthetase class 2
VGLPGAAHPALGSSGRAAVLALLGALVLVATLVAMLRPAGGPHPVRADEEIRLRGLLDHEGESDSLGYFALRRDKSVVFSASGKAAIAYRVVGGVSLASGDPLGDPEAWPGAIAAWLAEAHRFAWVPAVLGASQRGAQAFHRAGLDALELGDEAVVQVEDFGLDGRAMRGVRQAANRMCRLGYTVEVVRVADVADRVLAEVSGAVDRWRDGTTERGFSMALGRLGDPADAGCVLALARNADGDLAAVLHLVPWGLDGLSLDLMRRSPECDNGVVDLMVARLVAAASDLGISRVSLNFAVFRSVFEQGSRLGAGPVLRLWHAVLLRASRFWQLESLYRANAKYHPEWHPRYLCFSSARDLAMVLVAAMQAEAFLPRPRLTWGRPVGVTAVVPPADRAVAAVAGRPAGAGRAPRRDRRTGGVIR